MGSELSSVITKKYILHIEEKLGKFSSLKYTVLIRSDRVIKWPQKRAPVVPNFCHIQNARNFFAQGIHHFKPDLFPQFLPSFSLQERGNPIIPVSIAIVKITVCWDRTYGRISSYCQNLSCVFSPKVTTLTRLLEPDSGLRKRKNHSIWIPIR